MLKFFFGASVGHVTGDDTAGLMFADRASAQLKAAVAMSELFRDYIPRAGGGNGALTMSVRSDTGTVCRIEVNYSVRCYG